MLAVFLAVLLLPLLWGGGAEGESANLAEDATTRQLIIISPHNAQIRYEVERAFNLWHQEKYGQPVDIEWRSLGGTSDIERILANRYRRLIENDAEDMFAGYDMAFGGGDYFFDYVLKPGITVETDTGEVQLSMTEPVEIDPELRRAAFPEPRIADNKLYDPEGHWYGIVLSSFGIVYNHDWLAVLNEPEPESWGDIATHAFEGRIALADPSHSGSVRVTYNAILQRYGWARGLATLRRLFANARYFAPGSAQVPTDVSQGGAAAGVAIDFYGRYQSQIVGGGERVGYVAPADATVVTADPIAVLRGARHKETAVRLIEFLLTVEGQAVWSFATGDPMGPEKFELRRAPIRRDMYEKYRDRLVDKVNPFDIAHPLPEGTPNYFSVVPPLLHAMCMDLHSDLRAAWQAIGRVKSQAATLADRIEQGEVDDLAAARKELEALLDLHDRIVAVFDRTPTTDAAAVVRGLPVEGPGSGTEAAVKWAYRHAESFARVDWALARIEAEAKWPAVHEAWLSLREPVAAVIEADGTRRTLTAQRQAQRADEEAEVTVTVEQVQAAGAELALAVKAMPTDISARRAALVEAVEGVPAPQRTIDFHTTIQTIRGAVWKKHERAAIKDRLAWTRYFRQQYAAVVAMVEGAPK